ncbi:hypothetical protein [Saliphagus infecundisoli]|uniref:DUF4352 domain-containing protein n=1 Tax=Saliphagus infecundisoli TaxID=1849069 RepID=A0ABD5QG20_9EURY
MRLRNVAVIAVVVLVALSGCAAFGPGADDPANDTGEDEDPTDATDSNESDGENDSTESDTEASEGSADDPEENASDGENSSDSDGAGSTGAENQSDGKDENESDGTDENSSLGDANENATDEENATTGNESDEDDGSDANDTEGNATDDEEGNSSGLEDRTDDSGEDAGDDGADDYVDDTADAEWSPPEEPNRPLERKDDDADRIESIEFVDTVAAADGEGYSNFNVEVVANTSMERVDPPEHGDVVGEPYFFVKINEGADNQKIVERTGEVEMTENGTFHIPVRPDGLTEFGEREDLTVEVFLVDEDKDWDDVYDAGSETIHFNPGDGGNETDETDE